MAGNSHERGQSVVGRLLRILETFSQVRPELTIAEISRRSHLPPSTVYRLLAELMGRGVIERTADGRYAVGLRLWEIGRLAPRPERLAEVAAPYLHDLYEVTRGNPCLAVRVDGEALYVAAVHGHRCTEPAARVGTRVPLTSTGVGQVLLAYAPSRVVEQFLDAETATGSLAVSRSDGLRVVLAGIRRRGAAVARADGELLVAAPVLGPSGVVVAALALSVRDGEVAVAVPMVRLAGRQISRELLSAEATATDGALARVAGPGGS